MQLVLMITEGMEARIGILTLLVNKRKALVNTIAPTTKIRDSLLDSLEISCETIARQKPKNRKVIRQAMNCRSAGTAYRITVPAKHKKTDKVSVDLNDNNLLYT